MGYRLKEGVALFKVCGAWYIFPSRRAEGLLPVILSASEELACALQYGEGMSGRPAGEETEKKLRRLAGAGFLEECGT